MTEYSYKVAGLRFVVAAPENFDLEALLPSFDPFREAGALVVSGRLGTSTNSVQRGPGDRNPGDRTGPLAEPVEATAILFRLTLQAGPLDVPEDAVKVEEDENDMGHTRLSKTVDGSYCLKLSYSESLGGGIRGKRNEGISGRMSGPDSGIFMSDALFSEVRAFVRPASPYRGLILSSMLRVVFSQAILRKNGVSIHASAVAVGGEAFLFLGRSGTGKSTHAAMWLRNIPGSHLLNDDNPALRVIGGRVIAFGTPWSGKTPCYRDESFPVGGIVRLVQGDADIFTRKEDVAAFVALLPSCSAVHSDEGLQSRLCDTISEIIELAPVGGLECRPDDEAAIVCYNNLKTLIK